MLHGACPLSSSSRVLSLQEARSSDRSSNLDLAPSASYRVEGTAIKGADYQGSAFTGVVTFNVGYSTVVLDVIPIDDSLTEGNETVIVTLAANRGSESYGTEGGSATVTIIDTVVRVTANPNQTTEGSGTPGKFTITREGDFASELKVAYGLDGTATNGLDYQTIAGEIVIPASLGTVERNVTALVDSELEGPETVILTLAEDPTYYDVDEAQDEATVTILDGNVQAGSVTVRSAGRVPFSVGTIGGGT